ncbi:MAG TPA: GlcNAc-PI de-N-acetylase [Chloroflexi bacterium]|nr:GlcNAc-PI de-N-acetylase [Chloroflexota bacterium]
MREDTRRLLLSLAHPDDESFGMGGTIARYVDEGVEVYLICATNGELGAADPEFLEKYGSVTELRLAELRCAAEKLGITRIYTLGYRDSGMAGSPDNAHPDSLAAADPDEVAGRVTEIIREVRPQVVVTFDPFGGYGHPDHIAMHRATVRAFHAAPDPTQYPEQIEAGLQPYRPRKLYYHTFDRRWLRFAVRVMPLLGQNPEQFGRNKDINLRVIAAHEYPIHARIAFDRYTEIARQARDCHASQLAGFARPGPLQWLRHLLETNEDTFMRAYPPVNGAYECERDLFEGVHTDAGQ